MFFFVFCFAHVEAPFVNHFLKEALNVFVLSCVSIIGSSEKMPLG